jgi:Holliday junction resolvasome RuvABC endonuclease subunit
LIIGLGIDSAFTRTGWALVEREGAKERLIAHGLLEACDADVVGAFAHRMATGQLAIDIVVIEDTYLGENVDTLKSLSRLVGRWQQAFEALGLKTRLVMADVWQRGILMGLITGKTEREGRKKAAQIWANATFGEALPSDSADAAGIITWHLRQRAFAKRAGRAGRAG